MKRIDTDFRALCNEIIRGNERNLDSLEELKSAANIELDREWCANGAARQHHRETAQFRRRNRKTI